MIMMKPVDSTLDFQSYGPNAKIPFPQADIGGLITGDEWFPFRKENAYIDDQCGGDDRLKPIVSSVRRKQ
jgi:hypothetical protein